MNIKEIKSGAVLSYLLILANTFYGLFFVPFLISRLGQGEYGVYKIIASLIGSVTILDLGIGGTILRYIAKFNAENDKKNLSNFSAMGFIEATGLALIMLAVGIIIYFCLDKVYGNSLTAEELSKAKELFILFLIILIMSTYEKVVFGIIAGCEHYAFANLLKLLRIVLKIIISAVLLLKISDSAILLLVEIGLLIVMMAIQFRYIRKKIGIRIKFYYWDKTLFGQSFKYTILTFIQSVAVQFNGNLDNMVIGSVLGAAEVAVYSVGLQLYSMFEQFALAFSDLMLPSVSKQIAEGADNRSLEDTVIKIGRFEFIALAGALGGFIVIGKEFINLWLGKDYLSAWTVAIILMIPTVIPLIQNVCLSILRAKNKMGFRTAAVSVMAVFNLLITVIGVKIYGSIAACIGTAAGLILANIIAMNIYYIKVMHLNIWRIFGGIFSRTLPCCVISTLLFLLINSFIHNSNWIIWIFKVICFVIIYGALLLLYGLNGSEKRVLFGKILKTERKSDYEDTFNDISHS